MIIVLIKFIVCTLVILYCGKRVARYGDAIAEKTGLGILSKLYFKIALDIP